MPCTEGGGPVLRSHIFKRADRKMVDYATQLITHHRMLAERAVKEGSERAERHYDISGAYQAFVNRMLEIDGRPNYEVKSHFTRRKAKTMERMRRQ